MKKPAVDLARLGAAMKKDRLTLRYYREERVEAVRQFAGAHWAEEGTRQQVPVNLLALYTKIIRRSLIAKNPRLMLSTFDGNMKPMVHAMETWANQQIEAVHLEEALVRWVLDALFSIGIIKVALATPVESAREAFTLPAGQPFAEGVDLDDFCCDMHARDFRSLGYIAHRLRVPYEAVKHSPIYDRSRLQVSPQPDDFYNLEGDERISVLGRGFYSNQEEYEDYVNLWEIYLPRQRLIVTAAEDYLTGLAGTPLRVQKWLGPDTGPYHILAFGEVPGNLMPKGPIQDLVDLHRLVNNIYRKMGRQAERQKEVLLVQGGALEDGARIQQASDGEIVRNDNPDRAKVAMFGGVNQQLLQFGIHLKDVNSYVAGGLDLMGGLSPEAKTLGQERMLAENSSATVAELQDLTTNGTARVLSALCWYWWHDPFLEMETVHELPGLADMHIRRSVTPQQRQRMPFEKLQVRVDPYSMKHQTPDSAAAKLLQFVQQVYLPMAQLAIQQGVVLDLQSLLAKLGRYWDMPDLKEILTLQEPPQPQPDQGGAGQPEVPGQPGVNPPAETTRNYVRRSLGGDTASNREATMANMTGGMQQRNGQSQLAGGVS